ncbi:HB2L protein, partial [Pitta sordida]|nr:HB2L protein [Pitta sordida]
AVLVALGVLGAPPTAGEELSGVFQLMGKFECRFTNGTEQVTLLERHIYNREQWMHFDSDVGEYVGDTPDGEKVAKDLNSRPEFMESKRAEADTVCRRNYELFTPFSVERRGER